MRFNISNVTKPNFLIVGAAKSGTTSLANYLNNHPDIFISKIKEPRFLIADTIKNTSKKDPSYTHIVKSSVLQTENYFNLFKNKKEKAIGEASVHYLYHYQEAINNIKKYLGTNTKIIIVLRNPVSRAISNWKYQDKDFLDFELAINSENKRIKEGFNSFWYYSKLGYYHDQVKSYMENFKNTKVILFEDLINNTSDVMTDLYYFLGVDYNFKNQSYKVHNQSSFSIIPTSRYLKGFLKNQKRVNAFKKLKHKNLIPKKLYQIKEDLITEKDIMLLKNLYNEDIKKLQKLIDRDLTNWL